MSHTGGDRPPRSTRWTNDAPDRRKARGQGFASLAFKIIGALMILMGSFWITLKSLDYIAISNEEAREAATKEIRPTTWKTSGGASYEIRNGMVIFRGPDYIFNQVYCGSLMSNIKFSIFIERADEANMQLTFLNAAAGTIGEPQIQTITGMTNQIAELRSLTRQGANIIQAVIYSPRQTGTVVFKDPFIECKPVD
jgi:hypothetical protein